MDEEITADLVVDGRPCVRHVKFFTLQQTWMEAHPAAENDVPDHCRHVSALFLIVMS